VNSTRSSSEPADRPGARHPRRGFTLVEVMVVAIIIAVTAALAIPAATGQLRDRSTQRLAQDVAAAYRNGRTSAMARGGAVLVRFANGEFRVLEGIDGSMTGDVACAELPVAQCNRPAANAWEDDDQANDGDGNRRVGRLVPAGYRGSGAPTRVTASFNGAAQTTLDVCFTPLGRAFVRTSLTAPFTPMTGPVTLAVERRDGTSPRVGLLRSVIVPPNGAARMGAAQ